LTDLITQIIKYENGETTDKETVALFSDLIKSGQAWKLQGSYGRMASSLIDQGIIAKTGKILLKKFA
jgi:hypothetical protein